MSYFEKLNDDGFGVGFNRFAYRCYTAVQWLWYDSDDVLHLRQMLNSLVDEKQELIQQRDSKLKQVTNLAEMVADLKLQLESMAQQDHCKTQRYGIACPIVGYIEGS